MRKVIITLGCLASTTSAFGQGVPPVQEITKQIIRSVTNYGNAISCGDVQVTPGDIAALVPYKIADQRDEAMYAVLWEGDIGCAGGSGTSGTQLAIVKIGAGTSFVVDPQRSTPMISFATSGQRIIGNTRDTIILEGAEHGSNDARCCPSVRVRSTVRVDEKGNWKEVDKKVLAAKK